jgi:hypothetical protein
MKHNRVIATTVLFLLLGATLPAFAQKDKGEKDRGGGNQKQAQHQSQPQHQQQAQRRSQPQHQQQAQHRQQPQHEQQRQQQRSVAYNHSNNGNHGNHYGRISDNHYRAHFGENHSFHMSRPQFYGGYNRFQYGGYSFGFNEGWPAGWGYNDDCYVVFLDGGYYLYNVRHPGFRLTLNIF